MKDRVLAIFAILIILTVGLGCSYLNPFSGPPEDSPSKDKTITDRAVDTAVGEKKIGVPECDQVMDRITVELNNPDDDFVTKAVKATVLNRIKDGIKASVEENKSDTVELAKTCKEFAIQFDKYKAEQQSTAR